MIYKAILLFFQRFLWSKFKRRIKSKLWTIAGIVVALILSGGYIVSLYSNMTFIQGVLWIWGYIESVFEELVRVLLHLAARVEF